ncbi:cyclic nucleotide-binding domain-containing protein 2-like [Crotalus adamanteus]|uniref:Cyclic nucleotide-binding domain-containing protein 2-like n=1 Tax=Crotalus adamanteus TaxID=8729 RepID=A0AAW1CAZ9_CROAD
MWHSMTGPNSWKRTRSLPLVQAAETLPPKVLTVWVGLGRENSTTTRWQCRSILQELVPSDEQEMVQNVVSGVFRQKSAHSTAYGEMPNSVAAAVYIRLDQFYKGDYIVNLEDSRVIVMVSHGVELIRLKKEKIEAWADDVILMKLNKLKIKYPSDDELCQIFLRQNAWEMFKKDLLKLVMEPKLMKMEGSNTKGRLERERPRSKKKFLRTLKDWGWGREETQLPGRKMATGASDDTIFLSLQREWAGVVRRKVGGAAKEALECGRGGEAGDVASYLPAAAAADFSVGTEKDRGRRSPSPGSLLLGSPVPHHVVCLIGELKKTSSVIANNY